MSAALNSRPDTSLHNSSGSIPDLSLSIGSGISTPAKHTLRVPSASSGTTAPSSVPLCTPSPPPANPYIRRKGDIGSLPNHEEDGDLLNTPGGEGQWGEGVDTPIATRVKRTRSSVTGSKGSNLTLRDQEKVRPFLKFNYITFDSNSNTTYVASTSTISRKKTSTSNSASTSSKND